MSLLDTPDDTPALKRQGQRHDILARRLVETWDKRAQVKRSVPVDILLEADRLDFPTEELPFDVQEWTSRHGEATIGRICSLAWLAFNDKVISIESCLLVPCCKVLMDDAFSHRDDVSVELMAQAQTDEAFHVLMAHRAMRVCKQHRLLPDIEFPKATIIAEHERFERSNAPRWKKRLNTIAATVATEVLIKGYLAPISYNRGIQEFNRYVTNMHLIDEAAHGSVFRIIAHKLLLRLEGERYGFFVDRLRRSVEFFGDIDMDRWMLIFSECGIEPSEAIASELYAHHPPVDYGELDRLLAEAFV